jgi:uncharacterized membrane protein
VRLARLGFAFLTTAWIILLVAAPTAAVGAPASGLVYAFGALICHQRPDRSFYLGAAQLPVCARCVGLYAGGAAAALVSMLATGCIRMRGARIMLLGAALPTALTWLLEASGLASPSNVTRFMAALPLGAAVALTVNYVECARPQRNDSKPRPTPT